MGSLDRGMLTGFICRLCSEMHRVVIHIYGDEGLRLCLSEKINKYLPVNVSRCDSLPKTICNTCLVRLEGQHKLVLQIARVRQRLLEPRESRGASSGPVIVCDNLPEPSESSGRRFHPQTRSRARRSLARDVSSRNHELRR